MKSQRECYEAFLRGDVLLFQGEHKYRLDPVTGASQAWRKMDSGDYGWTNWPASFSAPESWSIYEEPKKPRVAEAFIHPKGQVLYALAHSTEAEQWARMGWERATGLDIVERES